MPLYRVDEHGDVQEIARLDLTHSGGCAAEFLAEFGWPGDDETVPERYEQLVARALAQGVVGSGAGGEFRKFEAVRRRADGQVLHVLVKFAGSDNPPGTQRWSDLLVCEQLASEVLPKHLGLRAATSRIHRFADRTFLEVERFDRHGLHGRSGVASWASVNGALFGLAGVPWTEAARHLAARACLSADDARQTVLLWHFGQLSGNSDMHDGNLSFQPRLLDGQPALGLAPAYDMLPMLYAPARGVELPPREFRHRPARPAERELWDQAASAAMAFWQTAAGDDRIGASFRALCEANAKVLARMR